MSRRPARLRALTALGAAFIAAGALLSVQPGTAQAADPGPDCGAKIAKGFLRYWKCTFADDFNGTTLDPSKWVAQTTAASAFTSGKDCFVDSPNNVSVSGGSLNLTVRRESSAFTCTKP